MKRENVENRVVIYTDKFYPEMGGGEKFSYELALRLSQNGYEVFVITSTINHKEDSFPFHVIRLHFALSYIGFNINFFEIVSTIHSISPSIVNISGPTPIDFVLIPILKKMHYKIFYFFHAKFNARLGKLATKVFANLTYRNSDLILCQSERDKLYLTNMGLNNVKKLYFNGVDTNIFNCINKTKTIQYKKNEFKFIFVGGITSSRPYKGIKELVELFIVIERNVNNKLKLIIVGIGDLLPELVELAKNCKSIIFIGELAQDSLISLMCDESNALILPSISEGEGFGRVVIEASSCGVPVLVSKYSGVSELISQYKAGCVYDPLKKDKALEAIISFSNNLNELNDYTINAKRMLDIEKLDLNSTISRIISLYRQY